ncbi:putative basic amino acid antiporter YfcC [Acidaminobacter sp. JC074]|uniref:putative basic amino acid antiporter YfcC n=1 Tax=Acidaminobacter sp. JC074 TaxID=2530199 RepID=UPI001F10F033|nr:putative basic amino acid antiporter YfcC [Acidaminobacter sp. JC074]MCH4888525.1 putative basic amino acid antiporter YfcC [Acidaminobacter sp. JC074]
MSVKNKTWRMPDTYVIIFFIVVIAALLTYIIPNGTFDISYQAVTSQDQVLVDVPDGDVGEFTVGDNTYTLDASGDKTYVFLGEEEIGSIKKSKAQSLEIDDVTVLQKYGDYQTDGSKSKIKLFEKWGGVGFLNFAFEGFVSGDKWGSAVGVFMFILIVGGAFGIVMKTGAVDAGILRLIDRFQNVEWILIPVMFFLFSLGGAIFGMGEEAIPFTMILVPLMVALGYDAITGILITYVATQIGFATSWMNPFSVSIAQGIAGVPLQSGSGFRIFMFLFFTALGIAFTLWYANIIKKDPTKSVSYKTDAYFRNEFEGKTVENMKFKLGHGLVLIALALAIVWIVLGVNESGYYLPEIATVFFTLGLVAGIIGVIFKLEDMGVNDIAISFRNGAKDLLGAAMVVGLAKGIVLVLGGTGASTPSVMNTILNGMAGVLDSLPNVLSAWFMYVFQSIFNFFVVSGSGQAALTMPLMAPLAELVGVTKQVAVLAFQLGDGFTNIIVPTSASLMGVLGVARVEWTNWFKFQIKFQGVLAVFASVFVIVAVIIGF